MFSSIDAEQAVIGACLRDSVNVIPKVLAFLQPEDFTTKFHRDCFASIIELAQNKKASTPVSLMTHMKNKKVNDYDLASFKYLTDNAETSNVVYNAETVKQLAIKRRVISGLSKTMETAKDTPTDTILTGISDILREAQEDKKSLTKRTTHLLADALKEYHAEFSEALPDGITAKKTIKTHMEDLDRKIRGLAKGSLIYLGGRPSMGKSTISLQWGLNIAKDKKPVLYCSFEIGKNDLLSKILCINGNIPADDIAETPDEETCISVTRTISMLTKYPFYFINRASSVADIGLEARKILDERGQLGAVIIDRLELLRDKQRPGENRTNQLSRLSVELVELAMDLDVPVVCLVQLSRQAARRGSADSHKPILSDLRDCGALEQDAKMVLFVHREEMFSQKPDFYGKAEIICAKNMFGRTGKVWMEFKKEIPAFYGIVHEDRSWYLRHEND